MFFGFIIDIFSCFGSIHHIKHHSNKKLLSLSKNDFEFVFDPFFFEFYFLYIRAKFVF